MKNKLYLFIYIVCVLLFVFNYNQIEEQCKPNNIRVFNKFYKPNKDTNETVEDTNEVIEQEDTVSKFTYILTKIVCIFVILLTIQLQ
jgi:hypothetical protein